MFSHGSYFLYNANEFDEDGNFTEESKTNQDMFYVGLGAITDGLARLSDIPVIGRYLEFGTDILGICAGFIFDSEKLDALKEGFIDAFESAYEYAMNYLKDNKIVQWVVALKNNVCDLYDVAKDWWNKNFNAGYKYSNNNPNIVINTDIMRGYAESLRSVSYRAKTLDGRMNRLYWKLGIDWDTLWNLGKLLKSGMVLDYAWRLDSCVNYLDSTANDFDYAENSIINTINA